MKKIYIYLSVLLFVGCYDNKGNNDYDEINKVMVKLAPEYGIRLQDTVFKITPELSQTLSENVENLEYTWLYSTTNHNFYGHGEMDTISRENFATLKIDPNDPNLKYEHYFRFNVYDKTTGIEYPYNTKLTIVKPYHGAWMLLHRENGVTKLGSVEYIGDKMEVCDDAYYRETNKHLQGNPLSLGVNYGEFLKSLGYGDYNVFLIATDNPDEAGVYCQWEKFRKVDSVSRMVAPFYKSEFDYNDIRSFDAIPGSYGAICLSGGTLFQTPAGMKLYKAPVDGAVTGDIYLTHGTKVGFASMFYDKAGRRFLFYYAPNRNADWRHNIFSEENDNPAQYKLSLIPSRDLNIKTTDPNNLSADKEVLFMGSGYNYDATRNNHVYCYGLARSQEKDSCYVYEFKSYGLGNSSQAAFSGFYQLEMPEKLNDESCFASTQAYNGIIYYGAGDKVYRLDFMQKGGKATPIYTHPGGKAKLMKFAYKGALFDELDYSAYEHDLNRSLGVVFEMADGTSEFVVLNLATTGKVDSNGETWPSVQVHKGFGDVKDIVFL